MTNPATTQLGTESRAVMPIRRSLEIGRISQINPSFTGQGVEVISAVEANGTLGIENVALPTDITKKGSKGISISYLLPSTVAAFRNVGDSSVLIENLSGRAFTGRTGISLDLGTIAGTTISGTFSTPVMASDTIKGPAGWIVGDYTIGLSRLNSKYWISPIEEKFEFRDRENVTRFLKENDFLISLIVEGYEKIQTEFGQKCRLILALVKDSESDHDEELFILVRATLSVQEASKCLERLDEKWWLKASRNAQCKLNIDFELA